MIRKSSPISKTVALAAIGLAGAALGACGRNASPTGPPEATADAAPPALPLTTGPETPAAAAPALSQLPLRAPVRVTRLRDPSQGYAYVDQAYAMSRAIGRAPPDYGFDYGPTRPWVWRTSHNALRIVEPVEGGERYYYYEPGATDPYLVQDPNYAYAYADGALVTAYDSYGRQLDLDRIDARADAAARFLGRARALQDASWRAERRNIVAANWARRRDSIDAERERWAEQQSRHDDWRAYHRQHETEQQTYWRPEQDRREQTAASFDGWSRGGYRDPPPPPVTAPLAIAGAALAARAFFPPHDLQRSNGGEIDGRDRRNGSGDVMPQPVYVGGRPPAAPPTASRSDAPRVAPLGPLAPNPRGSFGSNGQAGAIAAQQQADQRQQAMRLQQAAMQQAAQAVQVQRAQQAAQAAQALRALSAAQAQAAAIQRQQLTAATERAQAQRAAQAQAAAARQLQATAAQHQQVAAAAAERAQTQAAAIQRQQLTAATEREQAQRAAQALQEGRRQQAQAAAAAQHQQIAAAAAERAQAQAAQAAQAQAAAVQRQQLTAATERAQAQRAAQALQAGRLQRAQAEASAQAQAQAAQAAQAQLQAQQARAQQQAAQAQARSQAVAAQATAAQAAAAQAARTKAATPPAPPRGAERGGDRRNDGGAHP